MALVGTLGCNGAWVINQTQVVVIARDNPYEI